MHRGMQPHLLPPHALSRLKSFAMTCYQIRILDVGCGDGQWCALDRLQDVRVAAKLTSCAAAGV